MQDRLKIADCVWFDKLNSKPLINVDMKISTDLTNIQVGKERIMSVYQHT